MLYVGMNYIYSVYKQILMLILCRHVGYYTTLNFNFFGFVQNIKNGLQNLSVPIIFIIFASQ